MSELIPDSLPTNQNNGHPFSALTPECILDAVERQLADQGLFCDGRILALNSYENRVYQIGIEDGTPLIAKFYRPDRWSTAQILEEHTFCLELEEDEFPVVTPVRHDGNSLFTETIAGQAFRFSLFPRKGGRAPEFDNLDHLLIMGRWLARLHNIGAVRPFTERPTLDLTSYGTDSVAFITEHFIPSSLKMAYTTLTHDLLQLLQEKQQQQKEIKFIRTHCDCHAGNVLWRDDLPHFVDFDDARMAPAIQDLWMLLSGDRNEQTTQLAEILEGYQEFREFDLRELHWIEMLRTLRMMHYSAWLARRWDDPAFPLHFPWFNTERYWGQHILELREQLSTLQEAPLKVTL
ncbi:MAG TPA: serine/threonine protein kinase [Pseudomonadales bacterium]|nr:serine/threonine protein kinase [Pseudomonadales bacterium]